MKNRRIPNCDKKKDLYKYTCVFRCPTCEIINDFVFDYYLNGSLLLDNDENILIPRVMV